MSLKKSPKNDLLIDKIKILGKVAIFFIKIKSPLFFSFISELGFSYSCSSFPQKNLLIPLQHEEKISFINSHIFFKLQFCFSVSSPVFSFSLEIFSWSNSTGISNLISFTFKKYSKYFLVSNSSICVLF